MRQRHYLGNVLHETGYSPDMTSKQLSKELRLQLHKEGKTVQQLATHLGVCRATVHRRLANEAGWPLNDAMKAAKFAGIPAALVFFDLEEVSV